MRSVDLLQSFGNDSAENAEFSSVEQVKNCIPRNDVDARPRYLPSPWPSITRVDEEAANPMMVADRQEVEDIVCLDVVGVAFRLDEQVPVVEDDLAIDAAIARVSHAADDLQPAILEAHHQHFSEDERRDGSHVVDLRPVAFDATDGAQSPPCKPNVAGRCWP